MLRSELHSRLLKTAMLGSMLWHKNALMLLSDIYTSLSELQLHRVEAP